MDSFITMKLESYPSNNPLPVSSWVQSLFGSFWFNQLIYRSSLFLSQDHPTWHQHNHYFRNFNIQLYSSSFIVQLVTSITITDCIGINCHHALILWLSFTVNGFHCYTWYSLSIFFFFWFFGFSTNFFFMTCNFWTKLVLMHMYHF